MNLGIRSTSRLVDRIVDDYSTNEIVDSGSTSWQHAMKPDIGRVIFAYSTCIRRLRYEGLRRDIAITFGTETLEWCGYPIMTNLFPQNTQAWRTDRHEQTDGRTPHDGIGRAYA